MLEYLYFDFEVLGRIQGDRVSSLRVYLEFIYEGSYVTQLSSLQIKIAADAIATLQYLHGKNIVHRDLEPANILVSNKHCAHLQNREDIELAWAKEGICKLADFGESCSLLHQTNALQHTRTMNVDRETLIFNAPKIILAPLKASHFVWTTRSGRTSSCLVW